ncbi:MAG TPA: aminotransferase class V-fold PLP-dependent enzyme [Longimicrobiales bacterium]
MSHPRRRDFLRMAGLAVAGTALPTLVAPAVHGAAGRGMPQPSLPERRAGARADEDYWRLVKAQFPLRDGVIPMNAANLAPAPRPVVDAVTEAMRSVEGDVSFQNRAAYDELREQLRTRLAAFLGVSADEIAIVRNTSEANNIVAGGLALGRGDEVLLHAENHPSNDVAWRVRAARFGFTVRHVAVRPEMSHDEMLAAFAAGLTPRTRVLSFTDVSNVTGVRLPARALCALGSERGIHVHVDGAQSFGFLALDLRELGCDTYATSAHKWFLGPKEAGVLYARADVASRIMPGVVSVGWGTDAHTALRGARRFETLGQRNDATIAGLDAALTFHEQIGADRIEARVLELAGALKRRLVALPGATLVTPMDEARSGGVVVARFADVDARALHDRLYRDAHVASAPTGGLRLCPHICNTLDDVQYAADAVARFVA